jgi:hypothetical protein
MENLMLLFCYLGANATNSIENEVGYNHDLP